MGRSGKGLGPEASAEATRRLDEMCIMVSWRLLQMHICNSTTTTTLMSGDLIYNGADRYMRARV